MIKEVVRNIYIKTRRIALPVVKYINTHNLIREYDKVYGRDKYIVIFPPQGLGDILACCCGVEYLERQGKKVIILVNKKYFADIAAFFPQDYLTIHFTKKWFSEKTYKNYMPLSHKMYFPKHPYISMKHNICLAMDISPKVIFHNHYKINKNFEGLPLIKENKTVFLSPFATSCKDELDYKFWDELANKLQNNGFDVLFNAPLDSYYSNNYRTCLLNLEDTVELVSRCGYFIGWRSGLCDIIGMFANAKIIVIYPKNPSISPYLYIPAGMSSTEAFMNSCSLKTIWDKNAIEIINNKDLLNQIYKEIDEK